MMILQRESLESALKELMKMVNKCGSFCIDVQLFLYRGVRHKFFQETRHELVRYRVNDSDRWSCSLVPGGAWKLLCGP